MYFRYKGILPEIENILFELTYTKIFKSYIYLLHYIPLTETGRDAR